MPSLESERAPSRFRFRFFAWTTREIFSRLALLVLLLFFLLTLHRAEGEKGLALQTPRMREKSPVPLGKASSPNLFSRRHAPLLLSTPEKKKNPKPPSQQFAAAPSRALLAAAPRPTRHGRPAFTARAAIEAPRPSSPQPPPQRSSGSSPSEISNAPTTAAPASAVVAISPLEAEQQKSNSKRESVLCSRLAGAHSKAVTALLVLNDRGEIIMKRGRHLPSLARSSFSTFFRLFFALLSIFFLLPLPLS